MTIFRSRGFTLLELLVVIALVIILLLATIENLLPLRGAAERAGHAAVVGGIRSAIGLEMTERVLNGGAAPLLQMNQANPVEWLQMPMNNYIGEIASGAYATIPLRHWAFDTGSNVLVYRVGYPQYFKGDFMQPAAIRYRVTVEQQGSGQLSGVRLEQLDAGAWITGESEIARWLGRTNE